MECFACKTKMICHNDVNDVSTRIDWFKCPECNSEAEIIYSTTKKHIVKITWERKEKVVGFNGRLV